MRIGLDAYTIGHRGFSPRETLEFAGDLGLEGIQFLEPKSLNAALDRQSLSDLRGFADDLGLYLEVGLPSPNPVRFGRLSGRSVDATEMARLLLPDVEAVAALGCRHARVYCGDRHDRFRTDVRWSEQISATRDVLRELASALRDLDVRIAIETHADVTCVELLGLVASLGPEVAGVTVDTGNLVMRLDDPQDAVEKLAPWVLCTHVKDATLARTPRGLCWQARPLGSGILPLSALVQTLLRANPALNLSIELHPRTYDLPIHDPTWLTFFPDLRAESLDAVKALADEAEQRYAAGALARPEFVEAIPWQDRCEEWIDLSIRFLKDVRTHFAESRTPK
jgi:sugar phosphate isomerase/epimerase